MSALIPLSLYVHIPWCEKKCPYCDFNSHTHGQQQDHASYIKALINDLDNDLTRFASAIGSRHLDSIFIGGGTPSLFSAHHIATLLEAIESRIPFKKNIEITLEANPGSAEAEKFNGFRAAGINRLSIGIQSFHAESLQRLGRIHNPEQALQAVQAAKQAGFENINIDLMFGLPEQSINMALDDIRTAISLQTTHLSCYQLTIEPNTLFHHAPPPLPEHDALWEIQNQIQSELAQAGYQQYEVSAYAKPGHRCRHNLNYWQFHDYLGIGAGAHSKLTDSDGNIQRLWKIKHPQTYISHCLTDSTINNATGDSRSIAPTERIFEYMLNALRLIEGFNLRGFEKTTRQQRDTVLPILALQQQKGLLTLQSDQVVLTHKGQRFIDTMLQDYLDL